MPTIIRAGKFEVVIYTNDHAPAHVHVRFDDSSVKVEIVTGTVSEIVGRPRRRDVRTAVDLVLSNPGRLLDAWNRIHR